MHRRNPLRRKIYSQRQQQNLNPMSKEILIGLCGRAGSGKDTVASMLARHFHFNTYSMADPIRAGIAAMFRLKPETLTDRQSKEKPLPLIGKSPRYLMQTLGTEWGRYYVSQNIWVLLMQDHWYGIKYSHTPRLVVPDIRFDDEAEAILNLGGTVWKVDREDLPDIEQHESEDGVNSKLITGVIKNYGSLSDLETKIMVLGGVLQDKFAR